MSETVGHNVIAQNDGKSKLYKYILVFNPRDIQERHSDGLYEGSREQAIPIEIDDDLGSSLDLIFSLATEGCGKGMIIQIEAETEPDPVVTLAETTDDHGNNDMMLWW